MLYYNVNNFWGASSGKPFGHKLEFSVKSRQAIKKNVKLFQAIQLFYGDEKYQLFFCILLPDE